MGRVEAFVGMILNHNLFNVMLVVALWQDQTLFHAKFLGRGKTTICSVAWHQNFRLQQSRDR